jgi:hypothetical protein
MWTGVFGAGSVRLALRACYGSVGLSEDMDFTGGTSFTQEPLTGLGELPVQRLAARYGLKVIVSEPKQKSLEIVLDLPRRSGRIGRHPGDQRRLLRTVSAFHSTNRSR